jgi:hypothetical protein
MPYTETRPEQDIHNTVADTLRTNTVILIKEKHEAALDHIAKHKEKN